MVYFDKQGDYLADFYIVGDHAGSGIFPYGLSDGGHPMAAAGLAANRLPVFLANMRIHRTGSAVGIGNRVGSLANHPAVCFSGLRFFRGRAAGPLLDSYLMHCAGHPVSGEAFGYHTGFDNRSRLPAGDEF